MAKSKDTRKDVKKKSTLTAKEKKQKKRDKKHPKQCGKMVAAGKLGRLGVDGEKLKPCAPATLQGILPPKLKGCSMGSGALRLLQRQGVP